MDYVDAPRNRKDMTGQRVEPDPRADNIAYGRGGVGYNNEDVT